MEKQRTQVGINLLFPLRIAAAALLAGLFLAPGPCRAQIANKNGDFDQDTWWWSLNPCHNGPPYICPDYIGGPRSGPPPVLPPAQPPPAGGRRRPSQPPPANPPDTSCESCEEMDWPGEL